MDEIISGYKQYWPVLDLIVSRDIPEENDDDNANDNEGGDGSKDGGGAAASGGDKGKDKDLSLIHI